MSQRRFLVLPRLPLEAQSALYGLLPECEMLADAQYTYVNLKAITDEILVENGSRVAKLPRL